MGGGYFLYILFGLPALLFGLWAQYKVQTTYTKYSKVRSYLGLTGAEIGRRMLDANGLGMIHIEEVPGTLTDHYDPSKKMLRLSPQVARANSLAAAGVAAHEAGHALQDSTGYAPLKIRSFMVPTVQIGSWLGPILFMVGLLMSSVFGTQLAWFGLLLFSATTLFALVTLPVELDATQRAKVWLANSGTIRQEEMIGVSKVLDAAALTYVAAAAQSISTILYYAFLLLGRRDD